MVETTASGGFRESSSNLLFRFRSIGVFVVLILLISFAAIFTPRHTFVGLPNIQNLLSFGAEFGVIALGVGVLMIAGEFDLSIGSMLALCAFVFTVTLDTFGNPFIAAAITLAAGALFGFINGSIVVRAHIVSFIATLGMMLTYRGLTEILSAGEVYILPMSDYPLFQQLFSGKIAGVIPMQAFWFVLAAIILYFVLDRGKFGNWIYSTGANKQAARAMGIQIGRVKIISFMLVGFLTAFAAILQMTRVNAFSSQAGLGWELQAVAAAVVGGCSLQGGRGSMIGIFLGTLVIIVVDNMIGQLRLPYEYTYIAFALVILVSVLLDLWIEGFMQRARKGEA
ncbi:MAG: ABC transporter permease [Caldilineales bacterium]|nr:ABC transporter permease [Caldilineales bacterium]